MQTLVQAWAFISIFVIFLMYLSIQDHKYYLKTADVRRNEYSESLQRLFQKLTKMGFEKEELLSKFQNADKKYKTLQGLFKKTVVERNYLEQEIKASKELLESEVTRLSEVLGDPEDTGDQSVSQCKDAPRSCFIVYT